MLKFLLNLAHTKMRTVLKEMQLYVYIDASNIKNALKSLCIDIDWTNLYRYITSTYKNTIAIKYFQGIDKNDTKNLERFFLVNILNIKDKISKKRELHRSGTLERETIAPNGEIVK